QITLQKNIFYPNPEKLNAVDIRFSLLLVTFFALLYFHNKIYNQHLNTLMFLHDIFDESQCFAKSAKVQMAYCSYKPLLSYLRNIQSFRYNKSFKTQAFSISFINSSGISFKVERIIFLFKLLICSIVFSIVRG